jgi:hypothetical protein
VRVARTDPAAGVVSSIPWVVTPGLAPSAAASKNILDIGSCNCNALKYQGIPSISGAP